MSSLSSSAQIRNGNHLSTKMLIVNVQFWNNNIFNTDLMPNFQDIHLL